MVLFGYVVTAIVAASFLALMASIIFGRKEIGSAIKPYISNNSVNALTLILVFFLLFSVFFVSPVEQLYFDENIYQGIALNILHNGNAVWCQYGSAYVQSCPFSEIYHDPVGWSVFIAMAFALFGVSIGTAFALQLLVGLLSIVGVFLLSTALFKRNDIPIVAAAFMALNPQLFIWSRTQAVIDLPFMMLTIFTFFFFVLFLRKRSLWTFSMTVFSLALVAYTRIEAFILVPILIILYFLSGEKRLTANLHNGIELFYKRKGSLKFFILAVLLLVLLAPQALYIVSQAKTGDYGQTSGSSIFSLSSLQTNLFPNMQYFLGQLNQVPLYPIAFPLEITLAAGLGVMLLAAVSRDKERFMILSLLGLWFLAYFTFYAFFYAGSVEFGVDVRFMLEVLPPLAILAGFGVAELSKAANNMTRAVPRRWQSIKSYAIYATFLVVFAVYPFIMLLPLTAIKPQNMPQQHLLLSNVGFIYKNYQDVPTSCLVFSFTPDVWVGLNRSSAQIGFLGSNDANFTAFASHYSCYVVDINYWCQVPPYQNTTCRNAINNYHLYPIIANSSVIGNGPGIYRIINYTN